ncbi:MAG: LysR family glycine cleavage system transcriptional activator [Motiliproteus sp.]|jgi:LysR family glycine cleavage system transcriptional activator
MQRRLPSMIALNCFEVSARHLSFTKAGDELCLSQSAVSRQIKKLEQFLGCILFERVKQRLYLTDSGKEYFDKVSDILEQLQVATRNMSKSVSGRLRVGVEDALTTRWLIPKLHDFQLHFPDIETEIITDLHQLYSLREGYDVGVLCGDGQWPELKSEYLMPEELVAICTPELLEKYGAVENIKDVLKYPLIHHTASTSGTKYWLCAAGLTETAIEGLHGLRFEHFRLLVDAAMQGLGLTVVPRYFVAAELAKGQLVLANKKALHCDDNYYVVTPKNRTDDPKVQVFANWLLGWRGLPE